MNTILSVKQAQEQNVCRICKKDVTVINPDNPLILNFGDEYAHKNCLPQPTTTPTIETDAIVRPFYGMDVSTEEASALLDHARKLEPERDSKTAALEMILKIIDSSKHVDPLTDIHNLVKKALEIQPK
jgi:hypothetical protein